MEQILGIRKIDVTHTEYEPGIKHNRYRVVLPNVVLKKLNLAYDGYVVFKKGDKDVQLIKAINIFIEVTHQVLWIDVRKIMSKNRVCLSNMLRSFLKIEDGDYLVFIELGEKDIRLRKLRKNEKIRR